jgi:hypothetical protein
MNDTLSDIVGSMAINKCQINQQPHHEEDEKDLEYTFPW